MVDVLVLCEYPSLNGGERSLLAALESLAALAPEFRVRVAGPESGPLAQGLARAGVPHVPFSVRDEAGKTLPQPVARARLADLLSDQRPDLLHANSLSMARISGPVAAELDLPSLAHLRDILGLSAAAVADLNRHTRLAAVSQAARAFHVAQGLDAARTSVLYNGVDLERFRPRARSAHVRLSDPQQSAARSLRRQLGWPEDAFVAGTIGQVILRKGQDVLARAAARSADDPDMAQVHWAFVGERHSSKPETIAFEQEIQRTFAEAGLGERVRYLGTRDDVPWLLGEFDLLIHPARQEPLGRVLLEASAAGLPILATDVGGTREIAGPDGALLIPPDDERALADGLRRLATDASLRERLACAARLRAEQYFDARRSGAGLLEEYRRTLGSRRGPP